MRNFAVPHGTDVTNFYRFSIRVTPAATVVAKTQPATMSTEAIHCEAPGVCHLFLLPKSIIGTTKSRVNNQGFHGKVSSALMTVRVGRKPNHNTPKSHINTNQPNARAGRYP